MPETGSPAGSAFVKPCNARSYLNIGESRLLACWTARWGVWAGTGSSEVMDARMTSVGADGPKSKRAIALLFGRQPGAGLATRTIASQREAYDW